MPGVMLPGSTSGKAVRKPLASIACKTVAPAGSTSCHSCTSRGPGEYSTVTRSPPGSTIDLLCALHEGVNQTAGDLVEYRSHQGAQCGVIEAVLQFKFDLAGALFPAAQRRE